MLTGVNTPRLNPDWFVHDGFYGKAKPEFLDQIYKTIDEQYETQLAAGKEARKQLSGSLTKEQMGYLSSRYDPKHMSYSDYRSFLDDLCKFGYFAEEDKVFVGGDVMTVGGLDLVRVCSTRVEATITTDVGSKYREGFSFSGGNVLEWTRHLSTYGTFNAWNGRFEQTDKAKLYEKLYNVLSQMK